VRVEVRYLFIPPKPIKLEFILKDLESVGVLTCYTLLQKGRKLCLLEEIFVMLFCSMFAFYVAIR